MGFFDKLKRGFRSGSHQKSASSKVKWHDHKEFRFGDESVRSSGDPPGPPPPAR